MKTYVIVQLLFCCQLLIDCSVVVLLSVVDLFIGQSIYCHLHSLDDIYFCNKSITECVANCYQLC